MMNEIFEQHKVCVLIPTYNNNRTLEKVLQDVMRFTSHIVVVNDGSTDNTADILGKYPSLKTIQYVKNQGKGHALRLGFKKAVEFGYNYAITIDSDGQHFAEDLPKFIEKLKQHPQAIIMGARNMNQSSVPGKSSFGHKFSNFWFKVETGVQMGDTQSGYRLYPISLLKDFKFITKKFEFEIEVMVRAVWSGIEITEVPVRVYYAEKGERVSHFRPFKDFTRISILNTVLVTLALLYYKPRDLFRSIKKKNFRQIVREQLFNPNESDAIKAASVGFGIFMGIVPLWGFQLAIAIALSFALKLNKALVIIAANISIPPMIPIILFLSHRTGAIWMGDQAKEILFTSSITLEMVHNNFMQYVVGAVTLSVIAGIAFGVATYVLLKILGKRTTHGTGEV
ncbi:MAG TPA: DUF2062 domain-containing protein [Ohtaekwangia sp.]|uniref:DUF2062 domain-containing protein n=1 Tax=Ohtaekwangia sp. TaxID=2066019 RepID=UPI002F92F0AE